MTNLPTNTPNPAEAQAVDPGFPVLAEDHPLAFSSEASLMLNTAIFDHMQRVCKVYAASDVVPKQFQGNIANCMIAFELAHRMKTNAFMLMQSMYVVAGKPGLEAKLVIALVNMRGPFRGPIQYKFDRDPKGLSMACTAFATHKASGERCEVTVTWDIVEKEGWAKKPGSKWQTMRDQMFMYRAAAWLARAYCPEVIMGMHTSDELEDTYGSTRYVESTVRPSLATRLGVTANTPQTTAEQPQQPEEPENPTPQPQQSVQGETIDQSTGEVLNAQEPPAEATQTAPDDIMPPSQPTNPLVAQLMAKAGCDEETAVMALIRTCDSIKWDFDNLKPTQTKNLAYRIEQGTIKV